MIRPATPRYANVAPAVLNVTADATSVDLRQVCGTDAKPDRAKRVLSGVPAVIKRLPPAKVHEPRRAKVSARKRDRIHRMRMEEAEYGGSDAWC